MPYSIMLDAGHGGSDPGAVYKGRQEKDDTLNLVFAIGEILQNNDVNVEYTRTEDIYESPFQKAMEANTADVDFFVSIHRNSFPTDNTVSGVETLIYDKSGIKYEMAQNINEQLEAIGFVNLGVKERPNLVVLRRTRMPAVLVEVGFINSDIDNALFDDNFQAIAQAIADGILDTLNMSTAAVETITNIRDESENDTDWMTETDNSNSDMNGGRPETDSEEEFAPDRPQRPQGEFPQRPPMRPPVNSPANPPQRPPMGPPQRPQVSPPQNRPQYHVQTGAYRMEMYANRLLNELLEQDFPAFIDHSGGFYRVKVGAFDNLDDAVTMEHRLKRAGYPTVIVT